VPQQSGVLVLLMVIGGCAHETATDARLVAVKRTADSSPVAEADSPDPSWRGCASRAPQIVACEDLLDGHIAHGPMATFSTEGTSMPALRGCCDAVMKNWSQHACECAGAPRHAGSEGPSNPLRDARGMLEACDALGVQDPCHFPSPP
jgi:hypothetical protein